MTAIRKILMSSVLLATVVFFSRPATAQEVIRVPLERYSISPYLQESFLFLQGTTLPDMIKLDISLGMKYMHQPWRVYETANSDYMQTPVEDHFQIRPALSFAYRNWFDVALVVPISYQTAGQTDRFPTTVTGQEDWHMLDPELFVKVPFFHERISGFGLAAIGQMVFPFRTEDAFVGYNVWQGAVVVAADWRYENFGIMLNTGFVFREENETLNTTIGNEWLIRPGVSYHLPLGSYSLAFSAEGNIVTGLSSFFSEANENAFQMLLSVQLQPTGYKDGVYAAVGGGSHMQGGGYGVPISNVDSRLGYSFQWESKPDVVAVAEGPSAREDVIPEGEWEKPSGPTEGGEVPDADRAVEVGEVPDEAPPGQVVATGESPEESPPGQPPEGVSPEGERIEVASIVPQPVEEEPIEVSTAYQRGVSVLKVNFEPDTPPEDPSGIASGSSAIPDSVRRRVRSSRTQIAAKLRQPGARLLIVGFADKCFKGHPYLGNQYNKDLSRRRATAMLDVLKETMGDDLAGVDIRILAMGRRCANPKCRCSTPQMEECAYDRRVEIFIDYGEMEEYRCPSGDYWLAR